MIITNKVDRSMVYMTDSRGKWTAPRKDVNLTLQNVADLVADGGEIYNYPLFCTMTDSKYNVKVPQWLYPTDGESPIVKDWLTTEGKFIDNKWYCLLSSKKAWITGSQALQIAEITGVTLISESAYKGAIQEDVI